MVGPRLKQTFLTHILPLSMMVKAGGGSQITGEKTGMLITPMKENSTAGN